MQYTTGHVIVVPDSQYITGTDTLWRNNVSIGDFFKIEAEVCYYEIAGISDDTHLHLTEGYSGAGGSGLTYMILRDYTEYYNLPEIHRGDLDWQISWNTAMEKIDDLLHDLGA